jgi:hypothetical protein
VKARKYLNLRAFLVAGAHSHLKLLFETAA